MKTLSKYAIFLTFSMLSCAALAIQQSWVEWYQVEVIIFSQIGPVDQEQHPNKMDISYPKNIRELKDLTTESRSFIILKPLKATSLLKKSLLLFLKKKT